MLIDSHGTNRFNALRGVVDETAIGMGDGEAKERALY